MVVELQVEQQYTTADSATSLFDATFYVMSSAFNVYKVLDNNGGANSTVEPTVLQLLF